MFLSENLINVSSPGLKGYTAGQSFFIGRAQMSCLKSTNMSRKEKVEFNLNFEMAQLAEFQEAFSCSPRDPMHTEGFCTKRND